MDVTKLGDISLVYTSKRYSKMEENKDVVGMVEVIKGNTCQHNNRADVATYKQMERAEILVKGNRTPKDFSILLPRTKVAKKFCELVLSGYGKSDIKDFMEIKDADYAHLMQRYRGYILNKVQEKKSEIIASGILIMNDRISEKARAIDGGSRDKRDLGFWLKARNEALKDIQGKGESLGNRKPFVSISVVEREPVRLIEAEVSNGGSNGNNGGSEGTKECNPAPPAENNNS